MYTSGEIAYVKQLGYCYTGLEGQKGMMDILAHIIG